MIIEDAPEDISLIWQGSKRRDNPPPPKAQSISRLWGAESKSFGTCSWVLAGTPHWFPTSRFLSLIVPMSLSPFWGWIIQLRNSLASSLSAVCIKDPAKFDRTARIFAADLEWHTPSRAASGTSEGKIKASSIIVTVRIDDDNLLYKFQLAYKSRPALSDETMYGVLSA